MASKGSIESSRRYNQMAAPAVHDFMAEADVEIVEGQGTLGFALSDGGVEAEIELGVGQAKETPEQLNTPGRRALYNNLNQNEELAIKIDEVVKQVRPDGWRGIQAREQVIKAALFDVLRDVGEVERIFPIIKAQSEY